MASVCLRVIGFAHDATAAAVRREARRVNFWRAPCHVNGIVSAFVCRHPLTSESLCLRKLFSPAAACRSDFAPSTNHQGAHYLRTVSRAQTKEAKVVVAAMDDGGKASSGYEVASLSPTISVEWLKAHLNDDDVKVLDASWYMPHEKRDPFEEFKARRIPGALFFDLDAICDLSTDLPHMLPTGAAFAKAVSVLGIRNSDTVVVYDGRGMFSAPRLWWMFRVFGHERVVVLEGGLQLWKEGGGEVEGEQSSSIDNAISVSKAASRAAASTATKQVVDAEQEEDELHDDEENGLHAPRVEFVPNFQPSLLVSMEQVRENMEKKGQTFQHIDARPGGRFYGTAPEPRSGIPSGHIPGSRSVPFIDVLTQFEKGCLKTDDKLREIFDAAGVSLNKPILASCGTGVTATIVALALHKLGRPDVPVYDGSWTEWATSSEKLPIATSANSS